MNTFKKLFPAPCSIIGMIHTLALPGTPAYGGNIAQILDQALEEAMQYKAAGIHGIILENMHDTPYLNREVGHEISTILSIISYEVKRQTQLPCGIQILAGANKAALATAKAARLDFIRAEGFVFTHVADEGIMQSDAAELLRYRKQIDAEDILIFTDIKKKHSAHALTSDVDILETAKAAEFFRSDGLIITGTATGSAADKDEVATVKSKSKLPVLVGSGITIDNVADFSTCSDALIIGSWFKKEGYWENALDSDRLNKFMEKMKATH